MAEVFIPEDVFENRCRWCYHGRTENGNPGIPSERIFSSRWHHTLPCDIMGIERADTVPGECLSFTPNYMYGICATCYFSSMFCEGFCKRYSGPKNKRIVFLGIVHNNDAYWEHTRSTCDCYTVDPGLKDLIMRDVLRGKSPVNFNPDTWEPLERIEGSPAAAQWQKLKEEAQRKEEQKKQAAQKTAAPEPKEEQMSLF